MDRRSFLFSLPLAAVLSRGGASQPIEPIRTTKGLQLIMEELKRQLDESRLSLVITSTCQCGRTHADLPARGSASTERRCPLCGKTPYWTWLKAQRRA